VKAVDRVRAQKVVTLLRPPADLLMMKALILVDMQNDFLPAALAVPEGDRVIPVQSAQQINAQ
jgi:hypothetical protein